MSDSIKVFVADGMAEDALAQFQADGRFEVTAQKQTSEEELQTALNTSHLVAVRSASKVRQAHLQAAKDAGSPLRLVLRLGAGVDNIDVAVAKELGIDVMNTASANALSAAEHTLAMMFAVARNVPQAYASLKNSEWRRAEFGGIELHGKRLAVLGCGQIGRLVAAKAIALGMKVNGYDPFVPNVQELEGLQAATHCSNLSDALGDADFVSLHLPKVPATAGMINDERISEMKDGAILVNVARGGLEDENAVMAALDSGKLSFYAVDVYASEPPSFPSNLVDHPRVVCTPHLGASTKEAQKRVGEVGFDQTKAYFFEDSKRGVV